ncbi:MAG: 50S ribosomal protein L37ae [Candidatus Micrarchaeota archaeon]|nr:50S ribosomal protein L37ae [Candidatus Micrarchaeota archaeon]
MASPNVRYGMKLRRLVNEINKLKKNRYVCPDCGKKKVKRIGFAHFLCSSCKAEYAGAAYSLSTNLGENAKSIIQQLANQAKAKKSE